MSQFILDEQLDMQVILPPLRRWAAVMRLQELRPGEVILDERVPEVLLESGKLTFVTIDKDFWNRRLCHPDYCILYFALRDEQQKLLPPLLRALMKLKEFATRTARMGKVARIGPRRIDYFEYLVAHARQLNWPVGGRWRRKR